MNKVWEGELSCTCGENHQVYCLEENRHQGTYWISFDCPNKGNAKLSSKLIENTVAWKELGSPTQSAILCKIDYQ